MMMRSLTQTGTTLVELIITIVIVSVSLVGILLVINQNTARSADPLIQHQSIAIAESYLEEILSKSFADPDGIGEGSNRLLFDNVADYNSLPDNVVRDQNNNAIAGLGNYQVTVTVNGNNIGPGGGVVAATDALLISVTVAHPNNDTLTISGYKLNLATP